MAFWCTCRVDGAWIKPITSAAYIYISRSDYQGFVHEETEVSREEVAPSRDQIRGHFKIADLPVLDTGRLLVSDLCSLPGKKANRLQKKRYGDEFDKEGEYGVVDETGGVKGKETPT